MYNSNILSNSTHLTTPKLTNMLSHDFTTCMTSKWMAHVWFAFWSTHWMQETLEIMLLIMNQICVWKWMLHSTEGCFLVIGACKLTQLFQVRWAAAEPVLLCDDQIHHSKLQLQFKIAHFTQFTACVQLSLPFQPSFFWKHGEQGTWTDAIKPKRATRQCRIY